jgi:hypothetical protein
MSIYEVAMRMLGSDSRKLLGLITASPVLPFYIATISFHVANRGRQFVIPVSDAGGASWIARIAARTIRKTNDFV